MKDNSHRVFADNLRRLREKKGITKWRLSILCGVAYTTYRLWEGARRMPGIVYGHRLAQALGCSIADLLTGIDLEHWQSGRTGTIISHGERLPTSVGGGFRVMTDAERSNMP